MDAFLNMVRVLSRSISVIAGCSLTFVMCLTVSDVILRSFRRPILGTYELVAFAGALVIGFALPYTTWFRGHIFVDFFILRFSQRVRNGFNLATRCAGILLFCLIGYNLIKFGMDLSRTGEVSSTLGLPFYPVAYGLGVSCFLQCLVLSCRYAEDHRRKI